MPIKLLYIYIFSQNHKTLC